MDNLFASLAGFVDQSQLAYVVDEAKQGINRARLIQGDESFEKDPNFNNTVHYLGGIGLSLDNLPEEILNQATIKKLENGEYATFKELEVVVLATARNRRLYGEIDGQKNKLLCGSNQDGFNSVGWSGVDCKSCQYHKKNMLAAGKDKEDSCKSYITALIYIPALKHTAIFTASGSSYMEAAAWLDQISLLSKSLAKKPEFQQMSPGLARVNPFFFKTTLKASAYKKNPEGKTFQVLECSKAEQPFDWPKLINSADVIKEATDIWKEIEEHWAQMYVSPNTSAAFAALPSGQATAALPAQSSAERVTVAAPALPTLPAASPAVPVTPAMPAMPAPAMDLPVSTITLDDADDVAPIGQVEMF